MAKTCAACGLAREAVVTEVYAEVVSTGKFEVTGVSQFWERFNRHLCASCRASLQAVPVSRREARRLLEEAVKLDPGNATARGNLKTVKSMG